MKKFFKVFLLICLTVILVGCAKTGEKDAVNFMKSMCKIPDSFVKVNYEFNKDTRLGRLDFKCKNMLGVELPGRGYFRISEDGKVSYIDTSDIDNVVLDYFEKNHSADFESLAKGYRRFLSASKEFGFVSKAELSYIENLDTDSYYSVRSFEKASKKYNRILKDVKTEYEMFPDDFKNFLNELMPELKNIKKLKYDKVVLTGKPGRFYTDWDYEWKRTDEYPN